MGKKAAKITLTWRQRAVLEPLARARTALQRLVERCRIVLMSAEGRDNEELAGELGVDRPGAPATFTAEQMAAIVGLACEPPGDSGLPVSHWTPAELARVAIKRKIVESISARHVDRFLAKRTSGRTRASTG